MQAVRSGKTYREVARRWRVSVGTVAHWVQRVRGRALDRVDWTDRSRRPRHSPQRTSPAVLKAILRARRQLRRHDALGEYGPEAIRRQLLAQGVPAPAARTIARWLARWGCCGTERWRRPPPPKGWYLPRVAAGRAELDSADVVEGLRLAAGGRIEVLNFISLWGGIAESYPARGIRTTEVLAELKAHWRQHGRPAYMQFDNDTIFTGAHAQRDYLGRVVHWCLCLGVIPVFTPPASLGFQSAIEAYNRRWQERVWQRWRHRSLRQLRERSAAFVAAYTRRQAERHPELACTRAPWCRPARTPQNLPVVLLRKLDEAGALTLCAQRLRISAAWADRLVRCEINVHAQSVDIFALRRRDPTHQPTLAHRHLRIRLVPWYSKSS